MKTNSCLAICCAISLCAAFSPSSGFAQTIASPASAPYPIPQKVVGEISKLEVKKNSAGQWVAVCDVSIDGQPRWLGIQVEAKGGLQPPVVAVPMSTAPVAFPAKGGAQQVTIELERPDIYREEFDHEKQTVFRDHTNVKSKWVIARLLESAGPGLPRGLLNSKIAEFSIAWPDQPIWTADREIRRNGAKQTLDRAVSLIDNGTNESTERAKFLLERLLASDSKLTGAYIELARVAMRSNWGQEGLSQAERYIGSALQIDPKNANAFVLRGYVYAHQGRFKLAEADFIEALKSETKNLWLWANWGELLVMQGKPDAAIAKYLKAIESPVTNDTYDRARLDAYSKLIGLYEKRHDIASMDAMYLQRTRDYGAVSCYGTEYAQFKLQYRGDAEGAIELAKDLTQLQCRSVSSKEVLGVAYYLGWARSPGSGDSEMLNRARVFFPSSAKLFLRLGESAQTAEAARRLVKNGESIDQMDNQRMTALAYAVNQRNFETVRRLIQLGARPTTLVGDGEFPVALFPVMSNDIEGVKLLKQLGVDYAKVSYRGMSAMEYSRRAGTKKLTEALNERAAKL